MNRLYAILLLSSLAVFPSLAETINGDVVGVTDGDTITLLDAAKVQHKIRLDGIDAPESNQAFGQKSKLALSAMVFGETVTVDVKGKDKYGCELGIIFLKSDNINVRMVKNGWAWHYVEYSKDMDLAEAENAARADKAGLWGGSGVPVAPWNFRATPGVQPVTTATGKPSAAYWVTKSSGVVHNANCRYYRSSTGFESADGSGGVKNCKICSGTNATAGAVQSTPAAVPDAPQVAPTPPRAGGGGQCAATTKKGTRCKRNAAAGSAYCWQH